MVIRSFKAQTAMIKVIKNDVKIKMDGWMDGFICLKTRA